MFTVICFAYLHTTNTTIAMMKMNKTMTPITAAAMIVFSKFCFWWSLTPLLLPGVFVAVLVFEGTLLLLFSDGLVGADVVNNAGCGVWPLHVW